MRTCPCCKEVVEGNEDEFEICSKCGWEDDPYQNDNIYEEDGANTFSLMQHRKAWIIAMTVAGRQEEIK